MLGNLEPKPGSIEGMIYTHTTVIEHILVLAAGLLQAVILAGLFIKWERNSIGANQMIDYRVRGLWSENISPITIL